VLYSATCEDCFIASHVHLPTHWAKVWDKTSGFFVRHDIAALRNGACSLFLGHGGQPCPSKFSTDLIFCIVDANGIHNTRIRFCACNGLPNRADQLIKAHLFPATVTQPTTAFTFRVLRQFHLHHLESKETAHDFMDALQRLTDNTFPRTVPVGCFLRLRAISVSEIRFSLGSFNSASTCHACLALAHRYKAVRTST